jgi:hypothetical protein
LQRNAAVERRQKWPAPQNHAGFLLCAIYSSVQIGTLQPIQPQRQLVNDLRPGLIVRRAEAVRARICEMLLGYEPKISAVFRGRQLGRSEHMAHGLNLRIGHALNAYGLRRFVAEHIHSTETNITIA